MPEYLPSINDRKRKLIDNLWEEGCAGCGGGGMMVGGDGFEGSSGAEGPSAGYDHLMGALKRLNRSKRRKKDG